MKNNFQSLMVLLAMVLGTNGVLAGSVSLTWNPSPATNVVGYNIYYGLASQTYTTHVVVGNVTNVTVDGLLDGVTYYFSATSHDAAGHESAYSNEASYVTTNPPPTLAPIANVSMNENAGSLNLNLTGITCGDSDLNETITVTAASSNPALISAPTVNYTSPNTAGTLTLAPAANAFGTATVTVTVNNGQASNNIVTQTFTVTVNPVNQVPTLGTLGNLTLNENAASQTVNLSGISSGNPGVIQTITVAATSSNPTLLPAPTVSYTSPNATGTLTLAPAANVFGTATVTVTANNGGASNNVVTRTFIVTVNPVNQAPTLGVLGNLTLSVNAASQVVSLSGIGSGNPGVNQTISVTAASSNPTLIPTPTVNYTSPNATGTLTFTPAANASGTATLTVTANNGGASNNVVTRTFTVTVNAVSQSPTLNALSNLAINENAASQTVKLSGISAGSSGGNQTITVTATSSNPGLIPTPTVGYTNANSTGTLTFTPVLTAFGTSTITVKVNNGGSSNNIVTQSFTVTVNAVNHVPTLNAISSLTVSQNAANQVVGLSGITTGNPNMNETNSVTAVSSNPALVPTPKVSYTNPNTTGSLSFTPATNATGTATVTVTVNNGGASNNIVSRSFVVTVSAPSLPPTLSAMTNMIIGLNSGAQTVSLTGIGAGNTASKQSITVTATSSNPALIPTPTVSYSSPSTKGTLTFKPATNAYGTAVISVKVNNGALANNTITQSFTVTVTSAPRSALVTATAASPDALLVPQPGLPGQFSFLVQGTAGSTYIVQSSSDLSNWAPMQTNLAPFIVVDANTGASAQRFYRAVLVPSSAAKAENQSASAQ